MIRKGLPVRKKMPPAPPQSLGTDGQVPLLFLVGQGMVQVLRKQTPKPKHLWCGELWSQGSSGCCRAGEAGTVKLNSHQLLVGREGHAAPPHSTELPVVCSQNGILLCQPKESCPAACKASLWWCAGCLFCKLSALLCLDKKLTVKMWSGRI